MGILDIFKTEPKPIEETVTQQEEEQQAHSVTVMRHRKRPQDDVPQDIITHYIVKDYQRMFNEVERLRLLGQQAAREVRKVLAQMDMLRETNDDIMRKNTELKADNARLKTDNARLKTELNNLMQKKTENGDDAIKTLARIRQIIEARAYLNNAKP